MTISGNIVDADLVDNDSMVVATEHSLWVTSNLGNSTTWTESYNGSTDFPEEDGTDLTFLRVRTSSGVAYALAYATLSSGNAQGYLFRSSSGGLTWSYNPIEEVAAASAFDCYKTDFRTTFISVPSVAYQPFTCDYFPMPRYDGDATKNPVAMGWQFGGLSQVASPICQQKGFTTTWNRASFEKWLTAYPGEDTFFGTGTSYPLGWGENGRFVLLNDALDPAEAISVLAYIDTVLGTGNYTDAGDWSMPLEDTRVNMPFAVESQGCGASFPIGPYPVVLWTFWAYTDLIVPKAMDVGRHNSSVVYVSANDKILRTSNGGITWEDYITDHGANDIECHQAQWSADEDITYWADDGHLYRASDGDYGSGLYLELSPVNTPYRISSDPVDGWPIYALPYSDKLGGNLIKIEQSSTNLVKLDLSLPIALHSTIGATVADRRYYFLDGSGIWYSSDGESFSDKQGGWTAYGSPRNIMPLGG